MDYDPVIVLMFQAVLRTLVVEACEGKYNIITAENGGLLTHQFVQQESCDKIHH